jgi:hypothetical protein
MEEVKVLVKRKHDYISPSSRADELFSSDVPDLNKYVVPADLRFVVSCLGSEFKQAQAVFRNLLWLSFV